MYKNFKYENDLKNLIFEKMEKHKERFGNHLLNALYCDLYNEIKMSFTNKQYYNEFLKSVKLRSIMPMINTYNDIVDGNIGLNEVIENVIDYYINELILECVKEFDKNWYDMFEDIIAEN